MECGKYVVAGALALFGGFVPADGAYTAPDPLDMRWTFGAHEPYTMYRRMGVRSTGGIHGNCYWLRDWFRWWDSEDCPKLMESLGLNWLLCRFYKGMGWEEEKKDFPNVKRFVENCHKHGVKAVAYIQFSTMYPETMSKEIPDLDDWAARRADGTKYYYSRYFRVEPCFNEPKFEEYLKKIIRIALEEGKFDGIFFDNAYMKPCFCRRCKALFHAHLQTIPDPADRFGFDSLSHFGMPEYAALPWGEVREPLLQEFNLWRTKRMTALYRRFYDYAHSVRPDCVVAANICPYRAPNTVGNKSVDMTEFPKCFDLVMGQVNNCPHTEGEVIVSRVRDLKYAREYPATYFASCDGAAGDSENEIEDSYLLPLIEDLVFGGVPADRTIMAPYPEKPEYVNHARLERRRPMLAAFNAFAKSNRNLFAVKDWMPVRFFVSNHAMMHSQLSFDSLMAAEEAALRGQVPFGYAVSTDAEPLPHADDAEVIVVANQTCLSGRQVSALVDYAKKGGRLVCTGESGRYDEWNRQRFSNPLKDAVKELPNVVWREKPDVAKAKRMTHIKYALYPPKDGPKPMLKDLAKVGFKPQVEVLSAPETVFAQYKMDVDGNVCSVHLVNYVFLKPVSGVRIRVPAGKVPVFAAPFDDAASSAKPREVEPGVWELPAFTKYAFCRLSCCDADGFRPLFNGRDFTGWKQKSGNEVKGWKAEGGVLSCLPNRKWEGGWKWTPLKGSAGGGGGDIFTVEKFRDFDLRLDFMIDGVVNSGIKYFYNPEYAKGTTLEYQILDPEHPTPQNTTAEEFENRRVASLYYFFPAHAAQHLKKRGEWNEVRIVSKGRHVEHWLNGTKVLEFERGDEKFREAFKSTKWNKPEYMKDGPWGEAPEGRILLQDHSDSVSFRNIRIKEL